MGEAERAAVMITAAIKRLGPIRSELVREVLEPNSWARAAAMDNLDLDELPRAWRDPSASLTVAELAGAVIGLALEVLRAGFPEPDSERCGSVLADGLICGHADIEHREGRCAGCLIDLGWASHHAFSADASVRYHDPQVYLGEDGRFHLIEDCALEAGALVAARERDQAGRGSDADPLPLVPVSEAVALRFVRCSDCGRSYGGLARLLRLKLAGESRGQAA